ncbi:hypothetical protein ACP4OV_020945 [Aristida adscensionis]
MKPESGASCSDFGCSMGEGKRTVGRVPVNPKLIVISNTQEQFEVHLRGEGTAVPSVQTVEGSPGPVGLPRKKNRKADVIDIPSSSPPPKKTRPSIPVNINIDDDDDDDFVDPKSRRPTAAAQNPQRKVSFADPIATSAAISQPQKESSKLRKNLRSSPREGCKEKNRINVKTKLNVRCNPGDVVFAISMLSPDQHAAIAALGFGQLEVDALESRSLLPWIMDRIDPDTMKIRINDEKILPITPLHISLVLGLPNSGRSLKSYDWTESVLARKKLLHDLKLENNDPIDKWRLLEEICESRVDTLSLRCFFMILFNRMLFPTSSGNMDSSDIMKSLDVESFGEIDWSQSVFDDIKIAVRKWHDRNTRQLTQTIFGCAIFLIVYYLDNLIHKDSPADWITSPRVMFYNKALIETLTRADRRKNMDGMESYGVLPLKSKLSTCYASCGIFDGSHDAANEGPLRTSYDIPRMKQLLSRPLGTLPEAPMKFLSNIFAEFDASNAEHNRTIEVAQGRIIENQICLANQIRPVLDDMAKNIANKDVHPVLSPFDNEVNATNEGCKYQPIPQLGSSPHLNVDATNSHVDVHPVLSPFDNEVNATNEGCKYQPIPQSGSSPHLNVDATNSHVDIPNFGLHPENHVHEDSGSPYLFGEDESEVWTLSMMERKIEEAEQEFIDEHGPDSTSGLTPPPATIIEEPHLEVVDKGTACVGEFDNAELAKDETESRMVPEEPSHPVSDDTGDMSRHDTLVTAIYDSISPQVALAASDGAVRQPHQKTSTEGCRLEQPPLVEGLCQDGQYHIDSLPTQEMFCNAGEVDDLQRQLAPQFAAAGKKLKMLPMPAPSHADVASMSEHQDPSAGDHAAGDHAEQNTIQPAKNIDHQKFVPTDNTSRRPPSTRLTRKPVKYCSPFKAGVPNRIPPSNAVALALRAFICAEDSPLHTDVMQYGVLPINGYEVMNSFGDDTQTDTCFLQAFVKCITHDDKHSRPECFGYRIFIDPIVSEVLNVEWIKRDTPNPVFDINELQSALNETLQKTNLKFAKMILIPVLHSFHWTVYCVNIAHSRIDVLDSMDYSSKGATTFEDWHGDLSRRIIDRLSLGLQRVARGKIPPFDHWKIYRINVPTMTSPNDCAFYIMKYLENYNGEHTSLNTIIQQGRSNEMRAEMLHYLIFHPANMIKKLPDELYQFR